MDNLHFVKELGYQSKEVLEGWDLLRFAELLNVHWQHKKKRSGSMSNPEFDRWYELARANGALGGKFIGAGGGGFLLFYAEDKYSATAVPCGALPKLGPVFWVLYGDSHMDIDYRAVQLHFTVSRARGLMTVIQNENP